MSVETAKYLGITFNNRLSFEEHINNLVKKLSKGVFADTRHAIIITN